MTNRIYRGPVTGNQPQTVNLPIGSAASPGTFVTSDGSELTVAASADGVKRLFLLGTIDFKGQSPTDAYVSGETAVAYRVRPDDEFMAQMHSGDYDYGDELSIGASGQLKAAVSNEAIVAYFDQPDETLILGSLADVVIADRTIKA